MARDKRQRAWNRTRLANMLCVERDERKEVGWLSIYAVLGELSDDRLSAHLRQARSRDDTWCKLAALAAQEAK